MPYTCPRCGRTSYHPKDAEHRYCGFCHRFEDDEAEEERRRRRAHEERAVRALLLLLQRPPPARKG